MEKKNQLAIHTNGTAIIKPLIYHANTLPLPMAWNSKNFRDLEVTKASLLMVLTPAQVVVSALYQSFAIYRAVLLGALEATEVSLFIVFPLLPRWRSAPSELPTCLYLS